MSEYADQDGPDDSAYEPHDRDRERVRPWDANRCEERARDLERQAISLEEHGSIPERFVSAVQEEAVTLRACAAALRLLEAPMPGDFIMPDGTGTHYVNGRKDGWAACLATFAKALRGEAGE